MPTIFTDYRNYTRFYLSWDVAQQDIANNRSLINWTAGIQGQPGWNPSWYSNAIRINSVYIDGQGNLASGTWSNITLRNGQTLPLRSGSVWVGHNGDGTKSFGASISGWLYANGDLGASGSWGIGTIPRNSQVTTNKDYYILGEPITVYTNRKSGAFTHRITIRKDNSGGMLLAQFDNIHDAVTWTPNAADIKKMEDSIPNSNRMQVWVHQHNHQVGQGSETYKYFDLQNANPAFSNFTYRDSNSSVVAITGDDQVLVKGQSTLETNIPLANRMLAVKGATPSRYSIVYDGITEQSPFSSTEDVVDTFTQVATTGQRTIIATAFDSRNNNTSVSKQVNVYDYTAPTIESTLTRENNFGDETTVHLNGNWNQLIINESAKNSLTGGSLKYRYREDAGGFGAWLTRNFTTDGATWQITTDFVVALDNTKKYVFEFQISDKFGTVTSTASVDIGKPVMAIGEFDDKPSIGIGKIPEDGALDVDGDIYSNGKRLAIGGWSEIGRITGALGSTPQTITFGAHKYLKFKVYSKQTGTGTTQAIINIKFNALTGNAYKRNLMRINSGGSLATSMNDVPDVITGITRQLHHQSHCEYSINGYPSGNICTGEWSMTSEDPDWFYATGRYDIRTSAPITSVTATSPTATQDYELIVYGHN